MLLILNIYLTIAHIMREARLMIEKRPRHYFSELMQITDKQERKSYIKTIPAHYKNIVRAYDKAYKEKKHKGLIK